MGYFRAFPAILGSGYEALWAGQGRASVLLSQQDWMWDGDHEGRASHRTGSKERGGKPALRIFTLRGSIPAAFTPNLQIYACGCEGPQVGHAALGSPWDWDAFSADCARQEVSEKPQWHELQQARRGRGCLQHDGGHSRATGTAQGEGLHSMGIG